MKHSGAKDGGTKHSGTKDGGTKESGTKDTRQGHGEPGTAASAQEARDSHQESLRRASQDSSELAKTNARQAELEVQKGVTQAQETARNNARVTHRNLTSSEKGTNKPNRTHKENRGK